MFIVAQVSFLLALSRSLSLGELNTAEELRVVVTAIV